MKKQILITNLLVLMGIGQLFAQLSYTPEKPAPGDVVKFTYKPPASVFDATDVVRCVVYKWGAYDDEFAIAFAKNTKPIDLDLKKVGNNYEGELQTDTITRLLSFLFTSGGVKWKIVESKMVLTSGKVDNNQNTGYAVQFYEKDGKVCQYSNYFKGEYLLLQNLNNTGFSNPEKATECFKQELETWPDSKYYSYNWLGYAMENDKEAFKSIVSKEMENLFATGLVNEKDWLLMADLAYSIKLKNQGDFFNNQAKEKFSKSGGLQSCYAVLDKFEAAKDFAEKEALVNENTKIFNSLSYVDKSRLSYSSSVPMYFISGYLIQLANAGRLDDYKAGIVKYNISIQNNPYSNYYPFYPALDTMLAQTNCKEYAIKMAQDYCSFYSQRVSLFISGVKPPPTAFDEYFSKSEQKEITVAGAALYADMCSWIWYKEGNYKKGFQYAKDAQKYLHMMEQPPYNEANYNNRYSLLAEKVLPAKECKAEVERLVASGAWKSEMIDILRRIYVREKKTENGFDSYIEDLKKSQTELLKKSLASEMMNEAAPGFSLTDIDGKTVNLSDFKGKIVILDFWATWCGPCKASFPAMKKLIEANINNPDLIILFVNTFERFKDEKENQEKVVDFIKTNNYPFHVLYDFKSKISADYKVSGIPTKCIIDRNGNLRYRIVGAETNESKLIDEINVMIESIN